MIEACCDADFTKAVSECCWNVTHGRAPLSAHKIQQLKRHGIVTEIVKQFHSYKTEKNCYSKRERIRIIITSITWSYSSGDIQTYKGKMTTKMILIPIDRLKALEKISTDTPAKMPADVEFKLLQQNKNVRPRVREPEQKKKYQWIVPCTICKNRREHA